ncbi:MAG: hypothetical protein ACRCSN_15780 [Dermatophilaceae bacterium]
MDAIQYRLALATIGSIREPAAKELRRTLREDSDAVIASRIVDAMNTYTSPRVESFWSASGHDATTAICDLTGLPEGQASQLVAAALHALILANSDVTTANVIGLAERAAAWDRGRTFGETTTQVNESST